MEWIIIALIAFYIFTRPTLTKYQTGNSTGGNTSTPVPNKNMPAFYQQSNSAPTSANDPRVNTSGTQARLTPIGADSGNNTENSSVSQEIGLGFANNGLLSTHNGIMIRGPISDPIERLPSPIISKVVTDNSPVSVPPSQTAKYGMDAASIAPLPLPQPKIETVVPQIASQLVNNSYVTPATGLDREQAFKPLELLV